MSDIRSYAAELCEINAKTYDLIGKLDTTNPQACVETCILLKALHKRRERVYAQVNECDQSYQTQGGLQ